MRIEDTVVDKDTWLTMIDSDQSKQNLAAGLPEAFYDKRGVEYLAPLVDSYMTAPVAVYDGKPVEARTVVFDDINETLETMMNDGQRIIMYQLIYIPSMPIYDKMNADTFNMEPAEKVTMRPASWKMRFAKV